jgi:tetratricopeptide (TPR) repeat protein
VSEAGHKIGPYRLLAPIGKGAMGEVWRARDERLDRLVAVKIMAPGFSASEERRGRALREARAAAAVHHPGVVTLYDILAEGDELVLVMELVEGRPLGERLRSDGPLATDEALAVLGGIADALVAAHDKGILHRDIKSANVMLTTGGAVKVLDFGLAKLRDGGATAPVVRPARPSGAIALDATMPSEGERLSATLPSQPGASSEETMAGALLGTPLYMAPEQVAGAPPDERTEVFALGVVACEVATGKVPYAATTLDALFGEIERGPDLALPGVWPPLAAVIRRAMAHDREARYPTMRAMRDELAAIAKRRQRPRRAVGAAAALALLAAIGLVWATRAPAAAPERPGDRLVARALEEYDLFYGDKAAASLRAALKVAPAHPRALAYLFLFEAVGEQKGELVARAEATARAASGRAAALLRAGLALVTRGPAAARDEIPEAAAGGDRELAFWRAELAYRARQYDRAEDEFRALLRDPTKAFRGRIFDHQSAVLLYSGKLDEAVGIGRHYAEAFPGEADAIGVHATTLAAAGQLDEALAAAREAAQLNEGEDTLAGLAKVHAYRGEFSTARDLYRRSLERAGDARRPVRRAALALMQLQLGDEAAARATVEPCLPGGADAAIRERGPCLFVAGLVDDGAIEVAAAELDRLAEGGTPVAPAYGFPANLAQLLRAKQQFYGGGCVLPPRPGPAPSPAAARDLAARLAAGRDFYAEYHLPYFSIYARCERAALLAATGDLATALTELESHLARTRGPTPLAVLAAELPAPGSPAHRTALTRLTGPAGAWPALEPGSMLGARLATVRRAAPP